MLNINLDLLNPQELLDMSRNFQLLSIFCHSKSSKDSQETGNSIFENPDDVYERLSEEFKWRKPCL